MRILLVNDYKEKIAGAEMYIWSIKEELENSGHSVKLFGSNKTRNEYISSQNKLSLNQMFKRIFNLVALYEFRKVVESFKPDIIHLHNIFYELSPSILLTVKNIPVIMTVHDNQIVNAVSVLSARTGKMCSSRICGGCNNCVGWKGSIYEKIKRSIGRLLLKKVAQYITPSKYMSSLIAEAGFKPVSVLPNGIKLLSFVEVENFNQLLFVGRLSKDKGVEYLLKSMPYIIEKFPKVSLKIVGDGKDKEYFLELVKKLDISANVDFVGNVSKDNVVKFYRSSTILIVPSLTPDNFPTVCIEAMSCGRAIIANSMGGIPELVDDTKTGFLILENNYKMFTDRVIELLSNRKLISTMSKNSYIKSQNYSIDLHISKLISIYQEYI